MGIIITLTRSLRSQSKSLGTSLGLWRETPWPKTSGGGRTVGCLGQPEPQTSTSVLDGLHSNISHRRQRPLGMACPGQASPHLTGAAPPTPAAAHLPPTTPLRTRGARLLRPGSRPGSSPLKRPNVSSALFLPVRPPSFGEEGERGRGKEWEVGERARRPSVVVSWLRAALAE